MRSAASLLCRSLPAKAPTCTPHSDQVTHTHWLFPCPAAGTFIIGGTDDIQTILDDQVVKIQAMNASPFIKPFQERAAGWEKTLRTLQVSDDCMMHKLR